MRLPTVLTLIALAVVIAFVALNWSALIAPTELSLGLTTVRFPLGVLMLILLALLAGSFLVYVLYLHGSVLLEARRNAKELQHQRDLADAAEASRFTQLREYLAAELLKQSQASIERRDALLNRIDHLEAELRAAIEQNGNSLAAYIGELEDRVQKGLPAQH